MEAIAALVSPDADSQSYLSGIEIRLYDRRNHNPELTIVPKWN